MAKGNLQVVINGNEGTEPRRLIAARITEALDEDLEGYCRVNHLKKGPFIEDAIREKLLRERKVIR
jgi:hypothetical protein